MVFLTPADLAPFAAVDQAKAQAMIDDASALAVLVAPCLSTTLSDVQRAAVLAILRGVVLRWNEAGTGALQAQAAGPFSQTVDTRQQRRGMFFPSEISQLQSVCATSGGAYTVSLAGPDPVATVDLGWA